MEMDIGYRFYSYDELINRLNKFCQSTNTKYWKRDARTIAASKNLQKFNPDLIYYELKFTCIYGGLDLKALNHKSQYSKKSSSLSLKTSGCPSYFRFKVTDDGECLQLVAMNLKHNHELTIPDKKSQKRLNSDDPEVKSKRLKDLSSLSTVEVEQEDDSSNDLLQMLEDPTCESIFEGSKEMKIDENYLFKGLVVPVLTPFTEDSNQSLNLDIIPAYARFLKENEIEGLLVGGITGEGMSMNIKERKSLTDAWVEAVSETKQHLIVHVGGAPLPDVLELAKHCDSTGVNCIMCMPDLFYKPQTIDELIDYLKIVSDAAPHTPIIYQHVPQKTNVNIHMGNFLKEISDRVPMLVGIEYSSAALDEGYEALKADDGKFVIFAGNEKIMAGAFSLGFQSGIFPTLNMWPMFGTNIFNLVKENKIMNALSVQDQLNSIIDNVTKFGNWISILKVLMKLSTPINVGIPRQPLIPLTEVQEKKLEEVLVKQNNFF